MEKIDLDISNYNTTELEEIFDLTYPYTEGDVENKKHNLYIKVVNDENLSISHKQSIGKFLSDVEKKLTNIVKTGIEESAPADPPNKFSDLKNTIIESGGNFIIENKAIKNQAYKLSRTDGLSYSDDGGVPPGIINPIRIQSIKRALNIDSRFRPDYFSTNASDLHLTLPYKFSNVINVRLASIQIPLTYYAINESFANNTFTVLYDLDASTGKFQEAKLIRLPDGNYNTSFSGSNASHIESVMNAEMLGKIDQSKLPLRYTVDRNSGRSIFAIDPSSSLLGTPYRIIFDGQLSFAGSQASDAFASALPFYLGWQLGFRSGLYDAPSGEAVASEGICYIKGPQYIFLALDDYNNNVNNYYISAYTDSINNKNILARLNVSSIIQSNGVYNSGEDDGFSTQINRSRNYFGPVDIQRVRLTLYDEYGRIINLNNMDWSCALMFEQVYDN